MEKQNKKRISITGKDMKVEDELPIDVKTFDDQAVYEPTKDLSKEKSEISKIVVFCIMGIIGGIIGAFILSILFRPDGIKPSGDLLTIITPIVITGLLGFLTGLAIGRKVEKE